MQNLGHGKAVDWWALGILLYELTVGIPPFYSQNVTEMYRKIQEAPLLFPPQTSNSCKDLIQRLLVRDAAKRLGAGAKDFSEIQEHSFWRKLDWKKLYNKEIKPPYQPQVKGGDADNPECFDKVFLEEAVVDTPAVAPTYIQKTGKEQQFGGWSFAPDKGSGLK